MRPPVGFIPTTPHSEDGERTEPAPSLPSCSCPIPNAAAAADPPLEPPAMLPCRHGLWVGPNRWLSVLPQW